MSTLPGQKVLDSRSRIPGGARRAATLLTFFFCLVT